MKLIRSSFWSYGFFCLSTPPLLLEFFILWFDVLGFLSFFYLAAAPSTSFCRSWCEALKLCNKLLVRIKACLLYFLILPSHLKSHFTISFAVSFSRIIWCLFTRVMSYAACKVWEKERNLLIFVEKTCTLQRKAVTLSCFSAQPLQGAPKAP